MLVKKVWLGKPRVSRFTGEFYNCRCTGWFLFGVLPLFVRVEDF